MDHETKKLLEDLQSTWNEAKHEIEELRKTGDPLARQTVDRIQDRMDQLEAQMQKATTVAPASSASQSRHVKAFVDFARTGIHTEETKALAIRDESLGGVLAPAEFVTEVIKGSVEFSPIRSIARVKPTTRTSAKAPKRTGMFSAQWSTETATRAETTGQAYGLEEIPTHEAYARVIVSNWDLEDPAVNIEADIREAMAEQFGVLEGAGFVNGNGVGKPEGFLQHPDITSINQGHASLIDDADGILALPFEVKDAYWPRARYVLNRFTLRDIRLLKDSSDAYVWQPVGTFVGGNPGGAMTLSVPATINGYPYTIAKDMPDVGADAFPVAFGNFERAYWIVDRIELAMLRDPFSRATTGEVVFHARKRVGGQVVIPEAIKLLKIAV